MVVVVYYMGREDMILEDVKKMSASNDTVRIEFIEEGRDTKETVKIDEHTFIEVRR